MDFHVRTLGTLNVIFGVASLVIGIVLCALYDGPVGVFTPLVDSIFALLLAGSLIFHMLLAVPCIVGGVYLRRFEEWSRSLVIITSALNILNFPLGCFLGCYGLWVLLAAETEPLFTQPLPEIRAKRTAATALDAQKEKPKSGPNDDESPAPAAPSPRS